MIFNRRGGFKMAIGLGLGMATYTFSTAKGYWRWVKRCDEAGVDLGKKKMLEVISSI